MVLLRVAPFHVILWILPFVPRISVIFPISEYQRKVEVNRVEEREMGNKVRDQYHYLPYASFQKKKGFGSLCRTA
ncbi:hypothetical protein Y032_0007g3263 [Ancylostoma ceylanicum]|uniref:Uncharacterized protein n=1 Tax=Ancylostoma ceylanicum TaxID=53326 RepID=A0A016VMI8_9BILA|nr:hypothetical protein Y032_0007g3263 [Ancylostoma ceylanicum]